MKHLSSKFCTQAIAGASLFCLVAQPATASVLHNGWQYSIDVSYDSVGTVNGVLTHGSPTIYEMYGMAIFDDVANNRVWVGFNGNFPLEGNVTGPILQTSTRTFDIENGSIAWGDLFFGFGATRDSTFRDANNSNSLYALKFSPNNDSGFGVGIYGNASGRNVGGTNAGYRNLGHHRDALNDLNSSLPGWGPWMGDLPWDDNYFDGYINSSTWSDVSSLIPNVISSGNFLGNATIHTQADLIAQGFDPGQFFRQGPEIFGVSFEKPVGFSGEFIATILSECVNDGMSLIGKIDPTPPPPPPPPEQCPVSLGQLKSLIPDEIDGEWKRFYDVASHKWYDPPAWTGMLVEAQDGTLFTQIYDFPCGISAENKFQIWVDDKRLGSEFINEFKSGDQIDFVEIFGEPIPSFKIIWDSQLAPSNAPPFALSLGLEGQAGSFSRETGSFGIRPLNRDEIPIPEPTSVLGLALVGVSGWLSRRWSGQPKD